MYFIVDTSVFIRAAFDYKSYSGRTFEKILLDYKLIYSKETLQELENTFNKDRLKSRIDKNKKDSFLNAIKTKGIEIKPKSNIKICRDDNDNMFLSLANDTEATAIITEDKDLLTLHPYKNTKIITSEQFIKSFL